MQSTGGDGGGGSNQAQHVTDVATSILAKLPKVQDVMELRKAEGDRDLAPTKVVLFQELDLYNAVLKIMSETLQLLLKGLKGEIGMNDQLDAIAFSLYNNFLPEAWANKAP